MRFAKACVSAWTHLYTAGMSNEMRLRRRAEIESDLWEFANDPDRSRHGASADLLLRLVRGLWHDVCWRLEQHTPQATEHGLMLRGLARQPLIIMSALTFSLTFHVIAGAATVWMAAGSIQERSAASMSTRNGRPVPTGAGRRPIAGQMRHLPVPSNGRMPLGSIPDPPPPCTVSAWQRVSSTASRVVAAAMAAVGKASAQDPAPPSDATLDAATRADVIDGALKALNDAYVFPEVAKKMEDAIRARQARHEYDAVTSGRQLAQLLTEHLREVSHDRHLAVNFIQPGPPPMPPAPGGAQTLEERQRTIAGRQNFGFARVERLAGNIGYLDLRGFMPPAVAGETATAAMTFLASSDAVIFDLRQNGGGDPAMVAFLTSYLFGQPVHLNDFYFRPSNETRPSWTLAYVPGRRLIGKDAYVLTSSRTFSGAEEFTYNLKNLKRATIVGETTGGGAHTVSGHRINTRFAIAVPSGRPINAVTGKDWEGVGVEPDVKVAADQALKAAHLMALEKLQQTLPGDAPAAATEVARTIRTLRDELGAVAASIPAAGGAAIVPASKAEEDFESGTLAAWRTEVSGSGGWFVYTSGKTAPNPTQTDPNFPFNVPDPPHGKFAAVVDANDPGRRILYRDITLDGRYRLRLTVFYVNTFTFSAANQSGQTTIGEEQQYRIDLVSPSAPLLSLAKDHLLANIFLGKPSDPARREPAEISVDLSPWAGQTVRLRFVESDFQGPLHAGVDNIRFERIEQ